MGYDIKNPIANVTFTPINYQGRQILALVLKEGKKRIVQFDDNVALIDKDDNVIESVDLDDLFI